MTMTRVSLVKLCEFPDRKSFYALDGQLGLIRRISSPNWKRDASGFQRSSVRG